MVQRAQALKLNALIVQVRPAADALYASTLEPWSEYLTGTQGRAPDEPWDPLAEWVSAAHAAGIELHAWFNPFRARHSAARSSAAPNHVSRTQPEIVRRYGEQLWLDPGEEAAQEHSLRVVADVLRRYDIDAVHIDDYFYPYPITPPGAEAELAFPDDAPWLRYLSAGGALLRDDWRRDNVNRFVQRLHALVRQIKPQVRLGISPFGLPQPQHRSAGIQGFSQFHKLYADVELWLREGWLDYLAPQLYWPIERTAQAFEPLLQSWLTLNPHGRHIWPGLFSTSVLRAEPAPWPVREILEQIQRVRQRAGATGHIHFSMAALMQEAADGLARRLQSAAYAQSALVPTMPWLPASPAPALPRVDLRPAPAQTKNPSTALHLRPGDAHVPAQWALWTRHAGQWHFQTLPGHLQTWVLGADATGMPADALVLSAVNRMAQEGPRLALAWDSAVKAPGRPAAGQARADAWPRARDPGSR